MSTELSTSLETEILALHDTIAEGLDQLRRDVVSLATNGANLGDHAAALKQEAKLDDESLYARLAALKPEVRNDVFRFAFRAARARRQGMLDNWSQLQFALADGHDNQPQDGPRPSPRQVNEAMLWTSQANRMAAFAAEWQAKQPVSKWDASVKASVKASLEPLVRLYSELQK